MPRHSSNETFDTMPNSGISSEHFYALIDQLPEHTFRESVEIRVPITGTNPVRYNYEQPGIMDSLLALTPGSGFAIDVNLQTMMFDDPWFFVRRVSMSEVLLHDEKDTSPNLVFSPSFRRYLEGLPQLVASKDSWKQDGWVQDGQERRYEFVTEILRLRPGRSSNGESFKLTHAALTVRCSRIILRNWRDIVNSMPANLAGNIYGHVKANRHRFHTAEFAHYQLKVDAENAANASSRATVTFDNVWPADTIWDGGERPAAAAVTGDQVLSLTPWLENTAPLTLKITLDQKAVSI